ncbi:MAG: DUF2779 domain-containing protein [Campylobacterales bacterium]
MFRTLACPKARTFWQRGEPVTNRHTTPEWVEPALKTDAQAWFEARHVQLHPYSQTRLEADKAAAPIDRLVQTEAGWQLEKIAFWGTPRTADKDDFALQVWLLERHGVEVARTLLFLPDKNYIRVGELDYGQLFKPYDLTRSVAGRIRRIEEALAMLSEPGALDAPLSPACLSPVRCPYAEHCFAPVPAHSVLNIARLGGEKKFELYNRGIIDPKTLPETHPLSAYQRIQIASEKSGDAFVSPDALADFLSSIEFPVYFLDFETVQHPVPPFEQLSPFEPLPFQYSLHILKAPGAQPEHHEFLAAAREDARHAIAAKLAALIGPKGSLVAYGADYERRLLRRLADWAPELSAPLESMAKRTIDLMIPFEKRWYYHPAMRGSCSLKNVAPVLDETARYDGLGIPGGREAMEGYLALSGADEQTAQKIRADLLTYGRQDSLSMVQIYEKLCDLTTMELLK